MPLNRKTCERARLARDARFDGLFFTGVFSTGIFCRPTCPAPPPKRENIVYYPTAAAAAAAGLRPCLRCRPEAAPGSPAWNGTSATVSRAIQLIRRGGLENGNVAELAGKLGVGSRHLRRLFRIHLGVSPKKFILTEKLLFAKKLLSETAMPITEIAFACGFGSIRRFNAAFRKTYGRAPSDVRKKRQAKNRQAGHFRCTLNLPYRPPFDWQRMLHFFLSRAIPGVESVAGDTYRRTVRVNHTGGVITVQNSPGENALQLTVDLSSSADLMQVVERVRRMFDLNANMEAINTVLGKDPLLAKSIQKNEGLRLPGAWDPFEVAVRAVVGQQISVKGARTVIGRIAARAGKPFTSDGDPYVNRFFPTAQEIQQCTLKRIGMPAKRVATIEALSKAVRKGDIAFVVKDAMPDFIRRLTTIPGIGDWTAQYIAMRALGEPDAFPAADLGIIKALQKGDKRPTPKQVSALAERWRPWRAYAAIYLWHA